MIVAAQHDHAGQRAGEPASFAPRHFVRQRRGTRGAGVVRRRFRHPDRPSLGPVLVGALHGADVGGRVEERETAQVRRRHHLPAGGDVAVAKQGLDGAHIVAFHHGGAVEAHAVEAYAAAQLVQGVALHAQAVGAAFHHRVVEAQSGAAPQADGAFAWVADDGHVGDARQRARLGGLVAFAVVGLDAVVASIVRLVDQQVLDAALPAVGPVEGVVGVAGEHDVLGVHGAAEELHAVVEIVVNLDEIHVRAAAHALEGDAVQLVLRIDVGTGVLHHDVVQPPAGIACIGAAEQAGVGLAFLGAGGGAADRAFRAIVDRRVAVDDQAAPLPAVVVPGFAEHVRQAGEGDRRGAGAVGD